MDQEALFQSTDGYELSLQDQSLTMVQDEIDSPRNSIKRKNSRARKADDLDQIDGSGRYKFDSSLDKNQTVGKGLSNYEPDQKMMTINPHSNADKELEDENNFNPGDLKYATVVKQPNR